MRWSMGVAPSPRGVGAAAENQQAPALTVFLPLASCGITGHTLSAMIVFVLDEVVIPDKTCVGQHARAVIEDDGMGGGQVGGLTVVGSGRHTENG